MMLCRFSFITIVAAALCILLLAALPSVAQSSTSATSRSSTTSASSSSGSSSANATSSASASASANATSSGNTTSTSTSTLANFPTATVPTTGSLAGTAVAPGPLATGSGTASGPDDSYIAAAVSRYGGGARGLVSLVLGAATLLLAGYLVL